MAKPKQDRRHHRQPGDAADKPEPPTATPSEGTPASAGGAQPTAPEEGQGLSAATGDAASKPWAAGVPEPEQTEALRLFREGNRFFEESQYPQALERYREAIKHWDHPAIRYNMVVCLVNLESPVEAFQHLLAALRFGEAPLGPTIYPQALTYKKLLMGRLAEFEVSCNESGAEVTLDGRPLFKGPGRASQVILPGEHQIVATKPGYLTNTKKVVVLPGQKTETILKVITLRAATKFERRWPRWKPWAVVGAGAGVALIGVPLQLLARSDYSNYDDQVARQCPDGCTKDELDGSLLSRARAENIAALSAFAVGGAVAVAGVTLVIMNQPRAVEPKASGGAPVAAPGAGPVTMMPAIGPGFAGASFSLRF